MIHEMNLNEKPFNNIDKGIKKVELRLYDKKRSLINLGDTIIFTKTTDSSCKLKVKVTGLLRFDTFEELFNHIDYDISRPANSLQEKLDNIHKIYSYEKEIEHGILAIALKKYNKTNYNLVIFLIILIKLF